MLSKSPNKKSFCYAVSYYFQAKYLFNNKLSFINKFFELIVLNIDKFDIMLTFYILVNNIILNPLILLLQKLI